MSGAKRPKRSHLHLPGGRTVEIRRSNLADGGYLSVYTDVTDATRIQQALAEQTGRLERVEGLLSDAIESMADGFQLWDTDDRLVLVNKAYQEDQPEGVSAAALGTRFADLLGQRVRDGVIVDAEGDPEGYIRDRLDAHKRANGEVIEQQLCDGRWMEIREQRTHVGGIVQFRRDITARKRAEEELARHRERLEELVEARSRELDEAQRELVRSERLAAIGQLTGTVSHELRNPLGTIRSSFAIVGSHLQSTHGPVARALERIERNIDRCVTIIDELLAYTRVRDMHLQPVAIDEWLTEQVVDEDIPHSISVVLDCQSGARVLIDRSGCAAPSSICCKTPGRRSPRASTIATSRRWPYPPGWWTGVSHCASPTTVPASPKISASAYSTPCSAPSPSAWVWAYPWCGRSSTSMAARSA